MIGLTDGAAPPLAVRLYRGMLQLLPRELRRGYGADAGALFHDMYREARRSGPLTGLRTFIWASGRLIFCAAQARWGNRHGRGAGDASSAVATGAANGVRTTFGTTDSSATHSGAPRARATTASSGTGKPPRRNPERTMIFANLLQDLRYALRNFARKPTFALAAIAIVAVGIGATTTIFSVVDAVVLRSLPYPQSKRIMLFTEGAHNFPDYNEWTTRLDAFGAIAGAWDLRVDVVGDGPPEQVDAVRVTPAFFDIFGATPYRGRFFAADEYAEGSEVALLGYGFWQRRWGGDPGIIGDTVNVDGRPLVVAGIVGPGFRPPEVLTGQSVDIWLPLDTRNGEDRDQMGLHVMSVAGRLADATRVEVAQEQLDAFTADRVAEHPEHYTNRDGSVRRVPLVPLRDATVAEVSGILYLLLGAVGLMLLIACANVANLFLARGTERGREIAVRGTLGAGRGRIVGQLLTESGAIAVVGGIGGVAIAYIGVSLFARTNPGGIPRLYEVSVDLRVLAFAFLASLATGMLFGILPALQAARTDVNQTLKEGAGSVTASRGGRRTRGALVIAEIALALVLLVGAGLLFRSLMEMASVEPGFDTEQLVDLSLQLGPTYTADERVQFVDRVTERLVAMPGTQGVAAGWTLPFVYHGNSTCCWRTTVWDPTEVRPENPPRTMAHPVTPGYFGMLRAPLRYGRDFAPADSDVQPAVAIVNVALAEEVLGTDNAVGRRLQVGNQEVTVIGVVEGVQHYGLTNAVGNAVYLPYERFGGELPMLHIGLRSQADLDAVVAGMREAVWALEPDLPIDDIVTMEQRVARSLATPRFLSLLLGVFAGVALLLACGGIYGSMLYFVSQRRREMGIRLALGAGGGSVIRMILGHGLLLTGVGLVLGIAGALALSRFMESLVWGIRPTDPPTFAGVTLALALAALAACFFPAFKASRADPLVTLRSD